MEDIIEKAKIGDEQSFIEIFMQLNDELYKIARTRLACEYDIDDAIQETLIETYYSLKKLKHIEYFKTWTIRILINKCNKIYSKRKKENISYEDSFFETYIEDTKQSDIENKADFYILIKDLNYDERIAIVLYYVAGYKTKEISKILNVNENTIKARISRSKEKIRKYIKEV